MKFSPSVLSDFLQGRSTKRNRTPGELPPETKDHILLTHDDPVTAALIEKLRRHRREYVLVVEDFRHATELYDAGIRVAVGSIDDPETYRNMRRAGGAP